jgi:hypothetical protein
MYLKSPFAVHGKWARKITSHNRSLYVSSLRSSAPLGRCRSFAFWLALPPVGGQTKEKRNILPSASQGHMPAPAWRPCRARRIAPERYAQFALKFCGKKYKKIYTWYKNNILTKENGLVYTLIKE